MITSLIEQATKLIGTAYLVSGLTPWVLFWLANATTFLMIIGPEAALRLWTSRVAPSSFAVALIGLAVFFFLVLGALLVASLTTVFALGASGTLWRAVAQLISRDQTGTSETRGRAARRGRRTLAAAG